MNQFVFKDKYTESIYSFMKKNQNEQPDLSDEEKAKINQLHEDTKHQLLTFYEKVNFNLRIDNEPTQIKLNKDDQEILKLQPLWKIHTLDLNNIRMVSESPYSWYLLKLEEVLYSIKCLDDELREEKFFDLPINWLINKGIILPSKCPKCKNDHKTFREIDGNFYWECKNKNCPTKSMELCNHFHYCNRTIKELPFFIYNWAIYGNSGLFKKSKSMSNPSLGGNTIRLVCDSIKQICKKTNEFYVQKLGENGKKVELFSCTFSDLITIFALEVDTCHIKFVVLDDDNFHEVISVFKGWFDSNVNLIIYEAKFKILKRYFNVEKREDFDNNRLCSFINSITELYQNNITFANLDRETFSLCLHELIWRHFFGKTPYSAFKFITSLIANQPCKISSDILNLIPKTEGNVFVEELFYGRFDQLISSQAESEIQLRNNIRCHKCYIPFNFQTFFNHLITHFNFKSPKRISCSQRTCHHCFAKFDFMSFQLHRNLLEGNFKNKNHTSACKICCISFKSRTEYINHLKETHRYQDQPYSCELCPFRTSFYHEKLNHYKINHSDIIKAYCKLCLKVFIEENSCSESVFNHVQQHYKVKNEFKCSNCVLSFINQEEFEDHFLHDHIVQQKKAFNFNIIKYKVDTTHDNTILKLKMPKNNNYSSPVANSQRRITRENGSQVRLTKKTHFKLKCEGFQHDNFFNKDYLLIANNLVICLECSQPIDTNHLSKREIKCTKCNFKGFCSKAMGYPCNLHMSGKMI